jgi:hypothetical protein
LITVLLALLAQRFLEGGQSGQHLAFDGDQPGDVHRRRKRVIGALRLVDIVVGMDPQRASLPLQKLVGPVGDHFVHVHVGLRAAAGLPDHQGKMLVPLPLQHLIGRRRDGLRLLAVQFAQPLIDQSRAFLQYGKHPNDLPGHPFRADPEVLVAALRLRPPQFVRGHPHFSQGIPFDSVLHAASSLMGYAQYMMSNAPLFPCFFSCMPRHRFYGMNGCFVQQC